MKNFVSPTLAVVSVLIAGPLASTPASAQTSADTFTGPRAEVTAGLDQLRFDLANVGGTGRAKTSDLGYGVAIGYDVALSPIFVAGIDAGLSCRTPAMTARRATCEGSANLHLGDVSARQLVTMRSFMANLATPICKSESKIPLAAINAISTVYCSAPALRYGLRLAPISRENTATPIMPTVTSATTS